MQIHRKKKLPRGGVGWGVMWGILLCLFPRVTNYHVIMIPASALFISISLSRAHYIYIYIDRYIPKTLSLSSFQIRSAIFFFYFSTYKEGPFLSNKISKKEKKKRKKNSTTKINTFLCRYIHH